MKDIKEITDSADPDWGPDSKHSVSWALQVCTGWSHNCMFGYESLDREGFDY